MELNRYVLTIATAITAFGAGAVSSSGLTEKVGKSQNTNVQITNPVGAAATTSLETWLVNNVCPAIVTAGALSCSAENLHSVRIQRNWRDANGSFSARVEGNVDSQNYQVMVSLSSISADQLKTWIVNQSCTELAEKAPSSNCSASNIFEIYFSRLPDSGGVWSVTTEAVFVQTCSEGSPE